MKINNPIKFFTLILVISNINIAVCQNYTNEDATKFFAQTKQVNQFIRRFNAEENLKGETLLPKDSEYHSKDMRFRYFQMIFDNQNTGIDENLKQEFIKSAVMTNEQFLDFYKENWYAEVSTKFIYKGKPVDIILFLEIERQDKGYKWVIVNLYFDKFDKLFFQNPDNKNKFLHPMSHELDFMNMHKIFDDPANIEYYYDNEYVPDYKTLFLYEIKAGTLKFDGVTGVKFHFFQIDNFYFELSNFNRESYNSGWLISNLLKIKEEDKQAMKTRITGGGK